MLKNKSLIKKNCDITFTNLKLSLGRELDTRKKGFKQSSFNFQNSEGLVFLCLSVCIQTTLIPMPGLLTVAAT